MQFQETPSQIGRYVIVDTIHQGYKTVIFRAVRQDIGQQVALKTIREEFLEDSLLRLFLHRQAAILASLDHPNICRFYDYDEDSDRPYIAMAVADGLSLRQWLDARPRTTIEILDLFIEIAQAIDYVHEQGVIHRDIFFENIIISAERPATLIGFDYGKKSRPEIAERESDVIWDITKPGTHPYGRFIYLAPERFEGPATTSSDCFAFFLMLYRALSGTRPYVDKTPLGLHLHRTRGPLVPPQMDSWDRIPRLLRKTISRGLQPNPANRHAGMYEILTELRRLRTASAAALPHSPAIGVLRALSGLAGGAITLSLGASWPVVVAISALTFAATGLLFACIAFFRLGWRAEGEQNDDSTLRYERAVELGSRSIVLGGSVSLLLLLWG